MAAGSNTAPWCSCESVSMITHSSSVLKASSKGLAFLDAPIKRDLAFRRSESLHRVPQPCGLNCIYRLSTPFKQEGEYCGLSTPGFPFIKCFRRLSTFRFSARFFKLSVNLLRKGRLFKFPKEPGHLVFGAFGTFAFF